MSQPVWNIGQQTATLTVGSLNAQVALGSPERGLHNIVQGGTPFGNVSLLGVSGEDGLQQAAIRLEDAYVRDHDLVADYALTAIGLKLRVYWNAQCDPTAPEVVALSLTASLRTDLLVDERPLVRCHTEVPTETVERLDIAETVDTLQLGSEPVDVSASNTVATLFRCAGDFVYAEMVHPADVCHSSLTRSRGPDGAAILRHELFTERLEKGVIVRARILGLILPQDDAIARIAERRRAFAAMQPPLEA